MTHTPASVNVRKMWKESSATAVRMIIGASNMEAVVNRANVESPPSIISAMMGPDNACASLGSLASIVTPVRTVIGDIRRTAVNHVIAQSATHKATFVISKLDSVNVFPESRVPSVNPVLIAGPSSLNKDVVLAVNVSMFCLMILML